MKSLFKVVFIGGYAVKHLCLAVDLLPKDDYEFYLYVDAHFTENAAEDYDEFKWGQKKSEFPVLSKAELPNNLDPNDILEFQHIRDFQRNVINKVYNKGFKIQTYNPLTLEITGDATLMTVKGKTLHDEDINDTFSGDFHIFDCRRKPRQNDFEGYLLIERFYTFSKFNTTDIDVTIIGFGLSGIWAAEIAYIRDLNMKLTKPSYKFVKPNRPDGEIKKALEKMANPRNKEFIDGVLMKRLPDDLFVTNFDLRTSLRQARMDPNFEGLPEPAQLPEWIQNRAIQESELLVFYENAEGGKKKFLRISLGIQCIGFENVDLGRDPKVYSCFSIAQTPTDVAPKFIKGSVVHWLYRGLVMVLKVLQKKNYKEACKLEFPQLVWVLENSGNDPPNKSYQNHLEDALHAINPSPQIVEQYWSLLRSNVDSVEVLPEEIEILPLIVKIFGQVSPDQDRIKEFEEAFKKLIS